MEQIKELTRKLIENSFKEIMLQMPFEKITIKTITDHANIIRPTFYNHFHDKYELMECIVKEEIIGDVEQCMLDGRSDEGIRELFKRFYNDRTYYAKCFEITGQNGFAEELSRLLTNLFVEVMKRLTKEENEIFSGKLKGMTPEMVAEYYSSGLITMIRQVIKAADGVSVDDLISSYGQLMNHTIFELI